VNRKHSLAELLTTLRAAFPRRGAGRVQDRVFFEYVLLCDVNDTEGDIERLVAIATSLPCKVNLITFNAHDGAPFAPSPRARVIAFRDALAKAGVTTTIRYAPALLRRVRVHACMRCACC
jgi:23S rRNA (adenine2503-C2)-methyltransferase